MSHIQLIVDGVVAFDNGTVITPTPLPTPTPGDPVPPVLDPSNLWFGSNWIVDFTGGGATSRSFTVPAGFHGGTEVIMSGSASDDNRIRITVHQGADLVFGPTAQPHSVLQVVENQTYVVTLTCVSDKGGHVAFRLNANPA